MRIVLGDTRSHDLQLPECGDNHSRLSISIFESRSWWVYCSSIVRQVCIC